MAEDIPSDRDIPSNSDIPSEDDIAAEDDIPHEHPARLANIVTGKAKEVFGRVIHRDDLVTDGEIQEEVAEDDVQPHLD